MKFDNNFFFKIEEKSDNKVIDVNYIEDSFALLNAAQEDRFKIRKAQRFIDKLFQFVSNLLLRNFPK